MTVSTNEASTARRPSRATLLAVTLACLPALAQAQTTTAHSLTATVVRNAVSLAWQAPSAPSGAVLGYQIDVGVTAGGLATSVPLGPVLAFSTQAPNGVYFVRVQALTADGPTGASNEVRIAVGDAAPPLSPLNLAATTGGGQATLQWTENPAGPTISGYLLEAGTAPGQTNVGAVPLAAAARSLSAPIPPGTYYARLRAANAAGLSAPSNEVMLLVEAGSCVPGPPRTLTATVGPGSVTVNWLAPDTGGPTTRYRLDVGSASGASNLASAPLSLARSFSSAAPAGRYFIRVVATSACGVSAPSNEVMADVPSGLTLPSFRGTWDGLVFNHPGSFGYGPITSFVLTFNAEPPSNNVNSIGVWTDNLGCRNPQVQAGTSRGVFYISSESLRCNDGDFTMSVTAATGNTLTGTCRGGCTFRMTKR